MRERFLEVFDRIWIDCLNGDKYKTGKLTPDGEPDPSVFSTEQNREGIQVGTAIVLLVERAQHEPSSEVGFRHFWGKTKRRSSSKRRARASSLSVQSLATVGLGCRYSRELSPAISLAAADRPVPCPSRGARRAETTSLSTSTASVSKPGCARYFDPR